LNFGLSPDFNVQLKVSLSESLSERLSQKLKWLNVLNYSSAWTNRIVDVTVGLYDSAERYPV